ncbi:MAG: outer membrane protein assembly factor BamB family protein [Candidatus Tyrphobacter sp.]
MKQSRRKSLIICAALLLGAAPSSWPMYQYFASHNAVFGDGGPAYAWRANVGGKVNGGLAVVGNTIYLESFAKQLFALDRRSGRVLWRARLPNIAMTTPVVADGLVIAGTGKDHVLVDTGRRLVWGVPGGDEVAAFDAGTGRLRWTFKTVGEDMPSPALVRIGGRDAIVFANGDDRVRALDVRTGRLLWNTALDGVSTMSSAAALDGLVYVLAGPSAAMHRPDHVYAIRANDGQIVWSAPYGNADDSPVAGDGRIFVEDAQMVSGPAWANAMNDVYALDARTGHLEWVRKTGTGYFTHVATNEEAIAAMLDRGVLFQSLLAARRFAAYDTAQGRVLWAISTDAPVKMSAIATGGRVYVGDTSGVLYTLDEGTGRVLSRRTFPKPFTCSSPVIVGSTLYVADESTIYALPIP